MKKIISIITITLLLFSCGKKEETAKEKFEVVAAETKLHSTITKSKMRV